MPLILPVNDKKPVFGAENWLAPNATVVGDVQTGEKCSFWFNSVVRGDVNYIRLGAKVNVQDGACIHGTYQKFGTQIGNNVSLGHNAIVHGCTIEDNVLVGMGAIVMDGAYVEKNCIIAAGAVVLEGTHIASGSIFAGVPAKLVKTINASQIQSLIEGIANNYTMYTNWYNIL